MQSNNFSLAGYHPAFYNLLFLGVFFKRRKFNKKSNSLNWLSLTISFYFYLFFSATLIVILFLILRKYLVFHENRCWLDELKYPPVYLAIAPFILMVLYSAKDDLIVGEDLNQFLYLMCAPILFFWAIVWGFRANQKFDYVIKRRDVIYESRAGYSHDVVNIKNHEKLRKWILTEEPVDSIADDYFERSIYASRIVAKLKDNSKKSHQLALIGVYGSGKSSVCRMVRDSLRDENFIFVEVDGWGRKEGAYAAQILNIIIEDLSAYVDCASLRAIPKQYLEALSGVKLTENIGLFNFLDVKSNLDPKFLLEKIDNILFCIDKKLIVILEDFDRGSDDNLSATNELAALLDRLRHLKHINFILCLGRSRGAGDQSAILSRISTHREDIGDIKCQNIFDEFLELIRYSAKSKSTILIDDLFEVRNNYFDVALLENVVSNPRDLKYILRRSLDVWERLSGEVNIHELILLNVLRFSSPEVLDYIADNINIFRTDSGSKGQREFIEKQDQYIIKVINFLFPGFMEPKVISHPYEYNLQRIVYSGKTDYFQRLYREELFSDEIGDQIFLIKYIDCYSSESCNSDFFGYASLHIDKYIQFIGFMDIEIAYKVVLDLLDRSSLSGFETIQSLQQNYPNIWSILTHINQSSQYDPLIENIFDKLFELNLAISNRMYDWFSQNIGKNRPRLSHYYVSSLLNYIENSEVLINIFSEPEDGNININEYAGILYLNYERVRDFGNEKSPSDFIIYLNKLIRHYGAKITIPLVLFLERDYVDRVAIDASSKYLNPELEESREVIKELLSSYAIPPGRIINEILAFISKWKSIALNNFESNVEAD